MVLAKSGLGKADLSRLWELADVDRDGQLCRHEFTVAMHLAACAVGKPRLPLPDALPPYLAIGTTVKIADSTGAATAAVVLTDDTTSVVSSLGYPEGLSDAGGSDVGAAMGSENASVGIQEEEHYAGSNKGGTVSSDRGEAGDGKVEDKRTDLPEKGMGQRDVLHERKRNNREPKTSKGTKGKKRESGPGERRDKPEAGKNEGEGSEYRMSGQDAARYAKAFGKLVEGKDANLGGKEVCMCVVHENELRGTGASWGLFQNSYPRFR